MNGSPQTLGDFDDGAPPLRVWTMAREEWVIARSASDAAAAYEEHVGEPMREGDGAPWTAMPDGEILGIHEDEGGVATRKTCAEWAASKGRGYLASANW